MIEFSPFFKLKKIIFFFSLIVNVYKKKLIWMCTAMGSPCAIISVKKKYRKKTNNENISQIHY